MCLTSPSPFAGLSFYNKVGASGKDDGDDESLGTVFLQEMRNMGATCALIKHSLLIMSGHVWVVGPFYPGHPSAL